MPQRVEPYVDPAAANENPVNGNSVADGLELEFIGAPPIALQRYDDPASTFVATSARLSSFVASRDPVALLAKSGSQFLIEALEARPAPGASGLEQAAVELLQGIALTMPRGPAVPTSPHNIERVWGLLLDNMMTCGRKPASDDGLSAPADEVSRRARLMNTFYRNAFNSDDAREIVPTLLARMDEVSNVRLGYRLSDLARAFYALFDEVGHRLFAYRTGLGRIFSGVDLEAEIDRLCVDSPIVARAWRFAGYRFASAEDRSQAVFQLSEIACSSLFMFDRRNLVRRFGAAVSGALFECSIAFGGIDPVAAERLHMGSPIRQRPFVRIDDETLFLPIPALVVSYPFAIVERLIIGDEILAKAYSAARTRYLEDAVAHEVRTAMPTARVYQGVYWNDPDTLVRYESDVVAVLGNHVFVLEAKSGKLKDAARRGGEESLRTNFRKLFVGAAEQAAHFEQLIRRGGDVGKLLRDRKDQPVELDLGTPIVVARFGVCIEHFGSLTSSRRHFDELGLIAPDAPWAPILSIGELRMMGRFLDTEISFFHYLTRRSTLEELISFVGDEQDILATYLTNGLNINSDAHAGNLIVFHQVDGPVRGRKVPRAERRVFDTPGIDLPPAWKLIGAEIYASDNRHRFDIIEAILNQNVKALSDFALRIRRWKSGGGAGKNLLSTSFILGRRVFVVTVLLARHEPSDELAWRDEARDIANKMREDHQATDSVVILRVRHSREKTFDGLSFFRFMPSKPMRSTGSDVEIPQSEKLRRNNPSASG